MTEDFPWTYTIDRPARTGGAEWWTFPGNDFIKPEELVVRRSLSTGEITIHDKQRNGIGKLPAGTALDYARKVAILQAMTTRDIL
jgi:hypothetical protein